MGRTPYNKKIPGTDGGSLASETGGWKKKWKDRLPVGLIYPNTYRVGMSNLGFQLVYALLNRHPSIVAERIFLPDTENSPLSVESGRPLGDFPILLCSVSFEHDYLLLLKLLAMAGIPPLASERAAGTGPASPGRPLIMAGGVATFINPEPLAPFIDLFIIGEAEPTLPPILDYLVDHLFGLDRKNLLWEIASRFPATYAPGFYEIAYNADGTLAAMTAPAGLPTRIKKVILPTAEQAAGHSQILTPHAEFADLYMTELGRGCSRGCRFCAAGFVYRPPRLWTVDAILKALAERPDKARRIGLLGMEMAKPGDLGPIANYLLDNGCSLSFSSLRADVISPELLEVLKKSGLKSAAIAPDGASERLRRVINKGITEDDILNAAASLVQAGIMHLKLYYMIGLPTETEQDLDEMLNLILMVKKKILAHGRAKGRLGHMTISLNSFIPKPWTPFQYHPFAAVASLREKIRHLQKQLAGEANIALTTERPEKTYFQAVLARGDRRLGSALLDIGTATAPTWQKALLRHGLQADFYAGRQRDQFELMPWEIIDHGIDRGYLWHEYEKALAGRTTTPCDPSICRRCGVCHDAD
ncbi:MAG: radical SAM protein [Deltaproteobacteria bacterium RIFOXYD12_FULL_57_12]|nr:MAG: radical SAM protein [Deltaproteobacteria bacterium RIFOXYD12_FULL_57_12]